MTINEVEKTYTVTSEKVTVPYNDVKDVTGEFEYEMEYNSAIYKGKLIVATKVITTKQELMNIKSYGTVTSEGTSTRDGLPIYKLNGYFVLGNNIDLTGENIRTSFSLAAWANNLGGGTDWGLLGTFDGRGYTLYGGSYGDGGLFGGVGDGAVIKNVAFVNSKLYNDRSGVLGKEIRGATIENVIFDIVDSASATNSGAFGSTLYNSTLKNVVIYHDGDSVATNYAICSTLGCTADNLYIITDKALATGTNELKGTYYTKAKGTTCAQANFTSLDNNLWVLTGDKAVFVSTAEFLD